MLRDLLARPRGDRSRIWQLTLADWEREQEEDRRTPEEAAPPSEGPAAGDVAYLVDALVPRLAAELARTPAAAAHESPTARLVTLDQLVAELPPAKKPETWKRWL